MTFSLIARSTKSLTAVLGGLFLISALRLLGRESDRPARQMFGFSILYLFLIFAALIIDKSLGLAV